MIDAILLYKSVSPKKTGNHPIVVTMTQSFLGFEGFEYTRLKGWAVRSIGSNKGIVGVLAYPSLMKWSEE